MIKASTTNGRSTKSPLTASPSVSRARRSRDARNAPAALPREHDVSEVNPSAEGNGTPHAGMDAPAPTSESSDRSAAVSPAQHTLRGSEPAAPLLDDSGLDDDGAVSSGTPRNVPIGTIKPSPWNPRKRFENLESLAASIKSKGLVSPLVVRELNINAYELIAGERRLRACQLAGVKLVPVLVRSLSDAEARELIVTENLQREDLHPLEEAAGVESLLAAGETIETVAARLGRGRDWVARRAHLGKLIPEWRKVLDTGVHDHCSYHQWEIGHFELIARLSPATQLECLKGTGHWKIRQAETLKDLQQGIDQVARKLSSAPWSLTDSSDDLVSKCPRRCACVECPERASQQPAGLFDDVSLTITNATDRCLNSKCFQQRAVNLISSKRKTLTKEYGDKLVLISDDFQYRQKVKSALAPREVKAVKKPGNGAKPALVVDGPDAGTFRWVKTTRQIEASKRAKGAADKPKLSDAEKAKRAREKLERERATWIVAQVKDAVEKKLAIAKKTIKGEAITPPMLSVMACYAIVCGLNYPVRPKSCKDDAAWLDMLLNLDEPELEAHFWTALLDSLADTLNYATIGNLKEWPGPLALWVAPLVGLDAQELQAKAAEVYPSAQPRVSRAEANAASPRPRRSDQEDSSNGRGRSGSPLTALPAVSPAPDGEARNAPASLEEWIVIRPGFGQRTVGAPNAKTAVLTVYRQFNPQKKHAKLTEVDVVERVLPSGEVQYVVGKHPNDVMTCCVSGPRSGGGR